MATTRTILRLFLGSPSDTQPEREIIRQVVDELNDTWAHQLGVELEVIGWETDVRPGVGADPQDVVNAQIGDDYDIFVGIFWTRIGSPTPRAGSGTVEEFQAAYDRYQKKPSSLQILMYFSNLPIVPDKIDPTQLAALKEFKASVGPLGVLRRDYSTLEEFETRVRRDLASLMRDWNGGWPPTTPPTPAAGPQKSPSDGTGGSSVLQPVSAQDEPGPSTPPGAPTAAGSSSGEPIDTGEGDEEGLFDLVEDGEAALARANTAMATLTEAMQDVTARTDQRRDEIQQLGPLAQSNRSDWKAVVNRSADDLFDFANTVDRAAPELFDAFSTGLNAFSRAVLVATEGDQEKRQVADFLGQLRALKGHVAKGHQQLLELKTSVQHLPRVTTRFQAAKRAAVAALDRLNDGFHGTLSLMTDLEGMAENIFAARPREPLNLESVSAHDVLVAPQGIGWSVLFNGTLAAGAHETKESAERAAEKLARENGWGLVVVGGDGRLQRKSLN